MRDIHSAPSVVVGVDGSRAATRAAIWAIDEAVSRDIPLRLVYVIDPAELSGADGDDIQFASARAALYGAQRAAEATGKPIKVETEILEGKPFAKLAEESRSAAMVCVGSIGMKHACRGVGSGAAALARLANCPVAVIYRPVHPSATSEAGSIVVEVDNGVVLRHAFEEARLRKAPLRAVSSWQSEAPGDTAEANRLVQAKLNHRIARWKRLYPDVQVEPIAVRGSVCRYLAANSESVQLFVSGPRGRRCDLRAPDHAECSVLTVPGNHL